MAATFLRANRCAQCQVYIILMNYILLSCHVLQYVENINLNFQVNLNKCLGKLRA